MNKNTLITIAIVAILLLGGFLLLGRSDRQDETELLSEEEEVVLSAPVKQIGAPNEAVLEFMNNLYQAVAPKSDPAALALMNSLLSPLAKKTLPAEGNVFEPLSFIGLQAVPDLGYEITAVRYRDNLATAQTNGVAEVAVKLKYSDGAEIEKIFVLSEVEDYWLIDGLVATAPKS